MMFIWMHLDVVTLCLMLQSGLHLGYIIKIYLNICNKTLHILYGLKDKFSKILKMKTN